MTRAAILAALAWATLPLAGAAAASLAISRTATVVGDPLGLARPRMLPGVVLDVAMTVTNPLDNLTRPVRLVTISDAVPVGTAMRVTDLVQANRGPVEFLEGDLLGLGLLASGLTYRFAGLRDPDDALEFSDGTTWEYQPTADAAGYDPRVRGVRVTLSGTQTAGGSFRLRYRTILL